MVKNQLVNEWTAWLISEYISVSKVKVGQSCPALCDPMDYTVCGILQARILEWVAFSFSSGSSRPRNRTRVSIEGRFFTSWATREVQKKKKKINSCNVFFLNISNKEEGRKLGSKENNLTNGFHGMTELKAFDSIRDHPTWFDRRSCAQSPTFADKETKTRRMKMCLRVIHELPLTPKPSFSVLFVWFYLACFFFFFYCLNTLSCYLLLLSV